MVQASLNKQLQPYIHTNYVFKSNINCSCRASQSWYQETKCITCSNVITYLSISIGNTAKLPWAVSHHSTKARPEISKELFANCYLSVQSIFVNKVFKLQVVTQEKKRGSN